MLQPIKTRFTTLSCFETKIYLVSDPQTKVIGLNVSWVCSLTRPFLQRPYPDHLSAGKSVSER